MPERAELPELLAPAGDFDSALCAFEYGADAVYLGLREFSARAEAKNFSIDELELLLAHAASLPPASPRGPAKRKVYVAFNTLADESALPRAAETLAALAHAGPHALIVQDLGIARMARENFPGLALHASTQLAAHNTRSVRALARLGFSRIVPARETTLDEIRAMCRCGVEIETFAHGALCYSISGLCLFSAMEYGRSGNCGRCAYCCRAACETADGRRILPFSMRDLRLDLRARDLAAAGVASLKIEGRMKTPLYVATAVSRYRHALDGTPGGPSREDLETVFSRRTTSLYIDGDRRDRREILDGDLPGHAGTEIGTLKRVTKDREGRRWLRFHTNRAIEVHDGLQFSVPGGAARPFGFAVSEIRTAISRKCVFCAPAGSDVEILLPEERARELPQGSASPLQEGAAVYCSASCAVKRAFPVPPFRPSSLECGARVDVEVSLSANRMTARCAKYGAEAAVEAALPPAKDPAATEEAVRKAFTRLGGTGWTPGSLALDNPAGLFAPPAKSNELRRLLVAELDRRLAEDLEKRAAAALSSAAAPPGAARRRAAERSLKISLAQAGAFDTAGFSEVCLAAWRAGADEIAAAAAKIAGGVPVRIALPPWTREKDFPAMRETVESLMERGFAKWEAGDLASLSLLLECGARDVSADWTLYALNRMAASALAEAGVCAFVASPESSPENNAALAARSPLRAVFLEEQTTPLFISATEPGAREGLRTLRGTELAVRRAGGLWITSRTARTRFSAPPGCDTRLDASWDPLQPPVL